MAQIVETTATRAAHRGRERISSSGPVCPVHHGDVGAVQLLRDAALLVLYLTKAIKLEEAEALNVYAIYTGLVYLTPLIGGRLADLYLGQRKAVFIGGILMALGQFALTQQTRSRWAWA